MKIALAQLNYHIGNFESNVKKITDHIQKAKAEGADIAVFSELAVCGYPPLDFLEFEDFVERCENAIKQIAKECIGIAAIVGGPARNPKIEGKNLYNAAYFLAGGKIQSVHHKGLLPNYDVFDEYRYFEYGREFDIINYKDKKIALTICEDLWDIEEDKMYTISPMEALSKHSADVMINIAASPFSFTHNKNRKRVLKINAEKYKMPLFYVNHVGAQTELIFDGGSLVLNGDGNVIDEMKYFEEDFKIYDLNKIQHSTFNIQHFEEPSSIELIHDALVLGIKDYFAKLGFKQATLGLSGGIDSAVVLVLAERALGKENVLPVLMPSPFSSGHSVKDAEDLAKKLGCKYETIHISNIYESFINTLDPFFKGLPFNVAEENLQARIRGVLLMAFTNKFGHILLNTSNKSELAVGYGTLYGDMAGGLSVLGDVYKTQVYELAKFINKDKEIIPQSSIVKPPSAELRPDQKDSDSLPEYDVLDKILYAYIELRQGPKDLVKKGFDKQLVDRVLKLVNTNEYKRKQFAPILRVSNKAFGMGRRLPIVGKYLS